jgi:hypothetical protein
MYNKITKNKLCGFFLLFINGINEMVYIINQLIIIMNFFVKIKVFLYFLID